MISAIVLSLLVVVPAMSLAQSPASAMVVDGPIPRHPDPAPPKTYTVVEGDTLTAIGVLYDLPVPELAEFNTIDNVNLILVGQVLQIPGSMPTATVGAKDPVAAAAEVPGGRREGSQPSYVVPAIRVLLPASSARGIWQCIGRHESGNNPAENTGNGYYGEWQDTIGSWDSGGGAKYASRPDLATEAQQLIVNERIQQQQGWGAWPQTSRMCGV